MPPVSSTTDIIAAGGTAQLPAGSSTIYVYNSTAALALVPPSVLFDGLVYTIVDAAGNAGSNAISFQGTIGGVFNPVLVDVAYGSATIQYHNSAWYRIS